MSVCTVRLACPPADALAGDGKGIPRAQQRSPRDGGDGGRVGDWCDKGENKAA